MSDSDKRIENAGNARNREHGAERLRTLADDQLAALVWKLQRTAADLAKTQTLIGRGLHAHYTAALEAARAEQRRRGAR